MRWIIALIILPMLARATLAEATNGAVMRFGIGLALLAEEQCEGYRRGPMFVSMMRIVEAGAKSAGDTLDKEALFARSKREAAAKLKEIGKGVCESAAKGARPGGVIERIGS